MDNPAFNRSDDLVFDVALSLLRSGSDTVAARIANEMPELAAPARLRAVAARLWVDTGERQRQVASATTRAGEAMAAAGRAGYRLLARWGTDYPELLREIPDPPVVLWVRGDPGVLSQPSVAVVGSRDATPMSLLLARTLGRELAQAGLTVVSGLARGVDGAAHQGALDGGGRTVGVLGSGLDVMYPRQHQSLADAVAATGAVISELPPGAPPYPGHFPLRNRIISGLSLATVVVEASDKSGSLITARMALDQGRDVLAVPGGPMSGRHRGCHRLIKDGARLVETVEDVLDELRWSSRGRRAAPNEDKYLQLSDLEANMAKGEPYTVDDLAARTGRSAQELLTELGFLELSGRVLRTAGGQYVRATGPGRGE